MQVGDMETRDLEARRHRTRALKPGRGGCGDTRQRDMEKDRQSWTHQTQIYRHETLEKDRWGHEA